MWIAKDWRDYELLDCGGGEKLERWDKQILVRPDPQAIWETDKTTRLWRGATGRYSRSSTGGGHWDKEKLPESWQVHYKDLTFQVKPMNFKHTGLFPEQAVNWDFAMDKMEEGPQYYPADQITDHPERFIMSELIREKVLQLTRQEVPHSVAVVIDKIERQDENHLHVQATIVVERPTQKNIVIGKQGAMIKEIGVRARKDIERLLGDKIFLETWVKVEERWRDKPQALQTYGYKEDSDI